MDGGPDQQVLSLRGIHTLGQPAAIQEKELDQFILIRNGARRGVSETAYCRLPCTV